ncbi:butyrate kinase [Gracilibacillus marinus]|uniref:Probable butyrate kinase n=1 Tax=Gracilibacillus marinus TaxID=630535 RepID=A0ABV8VZX0_9BACI
MKQYRILVINPLVHSTKIALFEDERNIFEHDVPLTFNEMKVSIYEQVQSRLQSIIQVTTELGINLSIIDAICGRGGLLRPIPGGTFAINEEMIRDLYRGVNGVHVSNLGAIIAKEMADLLKIPSYIVDPVVVDEMEPISKYTGIPEMKRKSIFHALNQKNVALEYAKEKNKNYDNVNLIIAHIGTGITVGAHSKGKVIDVNNGFDGEGAFSFERAGTLPNLSLVHLCFTSGLTEEEIKKKITYESGLKAYLNVHHIEEVMELTEKKDARTLEVLSIFAYQISKEIGMMSAVLKGDVDGILLTGQLAFNHFLVKEIIDRVSWIADIFTYPGDHVMSAMAKGTLRVLKGEETLKTYTDE